MAQRCTVYMYVDGSLYHDAVTGADKSIAIIIKDVSENVGSPSLYIDWKAYEIYIYILFIT